MTTVNMPARIILPIDFGEAIHVELTGELPIDIAAMLEQVRADAYARGRLDELQAVGDEHARLELLGENWRERAAADRQAKRDEDRRSREQQAAITRAERNVKAGRHPSWEYTGQAAGGSGKVCWDTGLPVETVNAWLRRPRPVPAPVVQAYRPTPPTAGAPVLTSWDDTHASVTPSVWMRIWGDLSDRTRRQIGHLDPARSTQRHLRRVA